MIYSLAIIFSIVFTLFILNLVRKNTLEVKYSIIWIILAILVVLISIGSNWIQWIAVKLGVLYTPSLMFLCAIILIIIYCIHLSIVITKQNKTIISLVQEIAIINKKIEGEEKNGRV